MRIGMDFRPAMRTTTGIGRYVGGLAAALGRNGLLDLRLFGVFMRGNRPAVRRAPPGTRLVAWPFPSRVMDLLGDVGLLPAERVLGGCDLFHHTNYILASVRAKTPQVMTIHDLAFLRDPSFHTPRAVGALREIVERAASRCAGFLVPSEATARDCEAHLRVDRDRLFVTPLGVDPSFFDLPAVAPARPYLLAVGTLEPRKNHARLIRAFSRARLPDHELWIAGKRGWLFDETETLAAAEPRVRLLGHVPDAELRRLLAGAAALVYPSLLEGFGLPVLEALAAGRPVLTSDREPLSTLAGDAALLVDPEDDDALAAGLEEIVADPGRAAQGPERARPYTWERCAAATKRAYEAVLQA